jgi:hypothetical protein
MNQPYAWGVFTSFTYAASSTTRRRSRQQRHRRGTSSAMHSHASMLPHAAPLSCGNPLRGTRDATGRTRHCDDDKRTVLSDAARTLSHTHSRLACSARTPRLHLFCHSCVNIPTHAHCLAMQVHVPQVPGSHHPFPRRNRRRLQRVPPAARQRLVGTHRRGTGGCSRGWCSSGPVGWRPSCTQRHGTPFARWV